MHFGNRSLRHDNGYTYGGITERSFEEEEEQGNEE